MDGKEAEAEAVGLVKRSEGCSSPGPARAVAPCLVKRYGTEADENCTLYNIFRPANNDESCSRKFIPELSGTTIYQKHSHQGWLIILCDSISYNYTLSSWNYGDCFLWNPITSETIQLPTLLEYCSFEDGLINDCVLSSPPPSTTKCTNPNPDNGNDDSMVFVYYEYRDAVNDTDAASLLFCHPGETQWRSHKFTPDIMNLILQRAAKSILCFKGKLYLMCYDYHNVDEHLDHHLEIEPITTDNDLTVSIKPFHVKKDLFPLVGGIRENLLVYYVETHDELFRVQMLKDWDITSKVTSIEVVRLNISLMEWEKLNSFGDHVLFLGSRTTTSCCSAAELGFTSGCLYYVFYKIPNLNKFEIESTRNTITLPSISQKEFFSSMYWVIMPGEVENMLGSKDEENRLSMELQLETATRNIVVNDKNQGSAGEMKAESYWDYLNEDVLGVIANDLHGLDYKNLRSVCKVNRAIMPKVRARSYLSPWVVFSGYQGCTIYNVVNPMCNDESYSMNLSDLASSTICFQKGGWLLITKKENIFFYNPLTRETVKLPDMNTGYCYSVVSFSSLPTSSDCIVFAMEHTKERINISFIRKGESHWSSRNFDNTIIERYISFLHTAVFHKGSFFCVDYHGTVEIFSAKENSWKVLGEPVERFDSRFQSYLIECAGDILLVHVKLKHHTKMPIKIFRLNISEVEWNEVKSLGEHMLFISHTSCVSAVAPNSYMKNNIYFPRLHLNDGGIVFYSLDTGSYHSVGSQNSAKTLYDTEGWLKNSTWIEPNSRFKSTSQELDWFNTPS